MTGKLDNEMASLLRAAFQKSRMSMKALADQAGVPYASVHAFVAGNRDPHLSTVVRLAKVLRLELRPVERSKRKG